MKHGIDIINSKGNALRPVRKGGKVAEASIVSSRFLACENGESLMELWKAVLRHRNIALPTDTLPGKDWGSAKGVDRIAINAKFERPPRNRPPQPLDANHLLDEFLKVRFPTGGIFRTAPKSNFPDSTEDVQAFVSFLKGDEYRLHPYTTTWLAELARDNPKISVLDGNLQVIREVRKEKVRKWFPGESKGQRGKAREETRFTLGPPSSAKAWKQQESIKVSQSSTSDSKKRGHDDEKSGEGSKKAKV